jgi:hypothetical protein
MLVSAEIVCMEGARVIALSLVIGIP